MTPRSTRLLDRSGTVGELVVDAPAAELVSDGFAADVEDQATHAL